MEQNIDNKSPIHNQINIAENNGDLNLLPKTRFSKRFEKLKNEIASDIRYEGILSDFEYYNTDWMEKICLPNWKMVVLVKDIY